VDSKRYGGRRVATDGSNILKLDRTLLNESGDEDQTAAATEEDVAPAATEENADMEAGRDGAGSYEAGQNAGEHHIHDIHVTL